MSYGIFAKSNFICLLGCCMTPFSWLFWDILISGYSHEYQILTFLLLLLFFFCYFLILSCFTEGIKFITRIVRVLLHHTLALKKYTFLGSIQINLFSINPGFTEEKLRNLSTLQSRTSACPVVRSGLYSSAVIFVMAVEHIRKMSQCQANFTKLKFKYIFCTISSEIMS